MSDWIVTKGGTRISKLATIEGASSITISDNCTICSGAFLKGNPSNNTEKPCIALGKNAYLHDNCRVEPVLVNKTSSEFVMGNYSTIGQRSIVRLSVIGNRVKIGCDCILGDLSIINDCCIIDDGTVVPARSVIPPYTRISGIPGKNYMIEEISAAYRRALEMESHLSNLLK